MGEFRLGPARRTSCIPVARRNAFAGGYQIAFVPESRQLVIEMDLPTFDVIPEQLEYRYVKAKDEIVAKARPASPRPRATEESTASPTIPVRSSVARS